MGHRIPTKIQKHQWVSNNQMTKVIFLLISRMSESMIWRSSTSKLGIEMSKANLELTQSIQWVAPILHHTRTRLSEQHTYSATPHLQGKPAETITKNSNWVRSNTWWTIRKRNKYPKVSSKRKAILRHNLMSNNRECRLIIRPSQVRNFRESHLPPGPGRNPKMKPILSWPQTTNWPSTVSISKNHRLGD